MKLAFVGCGFVADLYASTLANHRGLELAGVFDICSEARQRFAAHHGAATYGSYQQLLQDPAVELVVNLTSPASHYDVSRQALEAGKAVYSEKPLALSLDDALNLAQLARSRGLGLWSAPCTLLGETAQTAWRTLRRGTLGDVQLVYAELDDGPVYRECRAWRSSSGAPWPWDSEFETGCTMEHGAYALSWLTAFFGPARTVTAHSSCRVPDKGGEITPTTADFSVACITFESGVVARVTNSIVAPRDHSITVMAEKGTLSIEEIWAFDAPVYVTEPAPPSLSLSRSLMTSPRALLTRTLGRARDAVGRTAQRLRPGVARLQPNRRTIPLVRPFRPRAMYANSSHRIDFARGIAASMAARKQGRPEPLPLDHALHILELALAIQGAGDGIAQHSLTTRFESVAPMPWAQD